MMKKKEERRSRSINIGKEKKGRMNKKEERMMTKKEAMRNDEEERRKQKQKQKNVFLPGNSGGNHRPAGRIGAKKRVSILKSGQKKGPIFEFT